MSDTGILQFELQQNRSGLPAPRPEFQGYPKTPRLFRDIVITEKIDGTNAAIGVLEDGTVYAQSRKRVITPEDDNFGFATWVHENRDYLMAVLGVGLHFGEWWGRGVQRGYDMPAKSFSLFNTKRWGSDAAVAQLSVVPGLDVVPVLYEGVFDQLSIEKALNDLRQWGSYANAGFDRPEGIVIYHTAANHVYKVLLENDELPKGLVA